MKRILFWISIPLALVLIAGALYLSRRIYARDCYISTGKALTFERMRLFEDFSWQLRFVNWVRSRIGKEPFETWDAQKNGMVDERDVPYLDDPRIAVVLAAHPGHQVTVETGKWDDIGNKQMCLYSGLARFHRFRASVWVRCATPQPTDEIRKLFLFDEDGVLISILSHDFVRRRIVHEAFDPDEEAHRETPMPEGERPAAR